MKRDSEYINDTGMLYGQILWDLQPESGTYIPAPPVDDYRYDRDIDYHMLEDTYVENEHRGDYYIPTDRYHDVFRVSGYPGKRLFSFREVVVWLLNPLTWWRYQPSITWQGLKDTKQFFDEYPDSMITFG